MKYSLRAALCILAGCITAGLPSQASEETPPPEKKDLIGAWFGFDENRLLFCRLELESSGKGLRSTVYVNNSARLYSVERWKLDGFNSDVELKPVEKEAEPIYMRGLAGQPELVLEIGSVGAKWKRSLRLFNEKYLDTRNKATKERIDAYRAAKGSPH